MTEPRRHRGTTSAGLPGGRLYDAADLLVWLAGMNLLVIAFSVLGGVVIGLAPALTAAATVSRGRLRGSADPLLRTFARAWRRDLLRANAVLAPFTIVALLLGINLYAFTPTSAGLKVAFWVALTLVAAAATFALTLYIHYQLPLRQYALTAVRYLLHDLPAAALVAIVTVLGALLTQFIPGLLPVLTIGAWIHTVTAICISCYTRNDQLIAGRAPL